MKCIKHSRRRPVKKNGPWRNRPIEGLPAEETEPIPQTGGARALALGTSSTRAVLVSHWTVETSSARALTTGLFRIQAKERGLSRAQSLRRVLFTLIDQETLIDKKTGQKVSSYAHSFFWAPFSLIEDGGGGMSR